MDEYRYIDGDGDNLVIKRCPEVGRDGVRLAVVHGNEVRVVDVAADDIPAVARAMYEWAGLDWPEWGKTRDPEVASKPEQDAAWLKPLEKLAQIQREQAQNIVEIAKQLDQLRSSASEPERCGAREYILGVTDDGVWAWCDLKQGHPGWHQAGTAPSPVIRWGDEPVQCSAELRDGGLVTLSPLRQVRVSCCLPRGHMGLHEADMREHEEPLYQWDDEPGL